jgi:probable rRNA maturation factor
VSLDVYVSNETTRAPLGRVAIAEIARGALRAERVRHALLSITLLDRRGIGRINKAHLDHAGATDVISFGFTRAKTSDPVVGDEMARLVIHGVLHVLGYEHPVDIGRESSKMWKRQERLLSRAGFGPR